MSDFFRTIHDLTQDTTLTITFAAQGADILCTIVPIAKGTMALQPQKLQGTPEEFEANFFTALKTVLPNTVPLPDQVKPKAAPRPRKKTEPEATTQPEVPPVETPVVESPQVEAVKEETPIVMEEDEE